MREKEADDTASLGRLNADPGSGILLPRSSILDPRSSILEPQRRALDADNRGPIAMPKLCSQSPPPPTRLHSTSLGQRRTTSRPSTKLPVDGGGETHRSIALILNFCTAQFLSVPISFTFPNSFKLIKAHEPFIYLYKTTAYSFSLSSFYL
jgi:hypothetical protein